MDLWKLMLIAVALTVLVVLLMGPGMWSSDPDPLLWKAWRLIRGRRKGDQADKADKPDA
jgi:hypothetical protein